MAGDEARGWIGKEWKRKAEGEINVKFDNKEFKVSCGKGRHGRFVDWTFELDQATLAPYYTGERELTEVESGREQAKNYLSDLGARNELCAELMGRQEVKTAFENGGTQKALAEILRTKPGIAKTSSEDIAKLLVQDGIYFKREGGKVLLVDMNQLAIDAPAIEDEEDLPF